MTGHGAKFGRKQEAAIIGLLTMPTIDAAAKHADISAPTLCRWLQDSGFQAEYRKARRQALGQATAQLQQASAAAVKALKEIVEDGQAPASARVTAARTVLEIGLKAVEIDELEARLASLEQTMNGQRGAVAPHRAAR